MPSVRSPHGCLLDHLCIEELRDSSYKYVQSFMSTECCWVLHPIGRALLLDSNSTSGKVTVSETLA